MGWLFDYLHWLEVSLDKLTDPEHYAEHKETYRYSKKYSFFKILWFFPLGSLSVIFSFVFRKLITFLNYVNDSLSIEGKEQ